MFEQSAYLFIKPSHAAALQMEQCRLRHRLESDYSRDRFHATIQPLGDARQLSSESLSSFDRAMASLTIEPFQVAFDRLNRNALLCSAGSKDLRALQREMVRRLLACGLSIPDYEIWPHVSLSYRAASNRIIATTPIGWRVDEVLLVVSYRGEGRHEVLRRWQFESRQFMLPFAA